MRTDEDVNSRAWVVRSPADLGRAVAGIRGRRGMTQEDLARQLDINRSYLARLEAGAAPLALSRTLRALRRMGATVTITLPGDDGAPD